MSIGFKWDDKYSVGEPTIDKQHQKLLQEINLLLESIMDGSSAEKIYEVIGFLEQYVKDHFLYEEQYMEAYNYPGLEEHKKHHAEFSVHYNQFKGDLKKHDSAEKLSMEVEKYMGEWWTQHICHEDHQYAVYIKEHSV